MQHAELTLKKPNTVLVTGSAQPYLYGSSSKSMVSKLESPKHKSSSVHEPSNLQQVLQLHHCSKMTQVCNIIMYID